MPKIRSKPIVHNAEHVAFSDCAKKYAESLANPFTGPPDACMPDAIPIPSRKMRVFVRSVFTTGALGFGFVVIRGSAANDVNVCRHSEATYTGGVIATSGLGVTPLTNNSDYTSAEFGATQDLLKMRIVSLGLRVRYIGPELNRSGQMVLLEEPNHNSLDGLSFGDLASYQSAKIVPVDRQWHSVLYSPKLLEEVEYTRGHCPASCLDNIVVAVQGVDPTLALSFEYQYYVNFEIIGVNARGKTPSHSDPSGFSAVWGASSSKANTYVDGNDPKVHERSFLRDAARYLWENGSRIVQGITTAAKLGFGAYNAIQGNPAPLLALPAPTLGPIIEEMV